MHDEREKNRWRTGHVGLMRPGGAMRPTKVGDGGGKRTIRKRQTYISFILLDTTSMLQVGSESLILVVVNLALEEDGQGLARVELLDPHFPRRRHGDEVAGRGDPVDSYAREREGNGPEKNCRPID
jgi:hypothetical protein